MTETVKFAKDNILLEYPDLTEILPWLAPHKLIINRNEINTNLKRFYFESTVYFWRKTQVDLLRQLILTVRWHTDGLVDVN